MSRYKPVGWRNESVRHSLAAKGVRTSLTVSQRDVVNDLRRVNVLVGRTDPYKPIRIKDYEEHGKYAPTTALSKLGHGWDAVLIRSGLKDHRLSPVEQIMKEEEVDILPRVHYRSSDVEPARQQAYEGVLEDAGVRKLDFSVKQWQKDYPEITKKKFPGENPRLTKNFARFRQQDPKKYDKFRIKKLSGGNELVMGHNKKTGEWEVQSVMLKRKKESFMTKSELIDAKMQLTLARIDNRINEDEFKVKWAELEKVVPE